ncbi:MAG TPA: NAD(P)/FAD-dependent oxidoreductase [Steroidobacteraceae bacterium]|jgi:protoporphyrinogen oxidase
MPKTAVIVGAGPAGLTAALELQRRSPVRPIVIEADTQPGGISKTVEYRGNRMDLGGHRFFSKSDWVMNWWRSVLPVAAPPGSTAGHEAEISLTYQGKSRDLTLETGTAAADARNVMLVRSRLSRIFYRRRFFDYPLKLNWSTLANLGPGYTAAIAASYAAARVAPRKPEVTLEDFLINRFGDKLYRTFFKDYTEKVWGVGCDAISAEWGAQRIKGLSITRALAHAVAKPFRRLTDTAQKGVETSLIERFLYPRLGPGQMWEECARKLTDAGGELHLRHRVVGIHRSGKCIQGVDVRDEQSGSVRRIDCDFLISTMPIKELAGLLHIEDPEVMRIASALPYRDFMTAGLLVRKMLPTGTDGRSAGNGMPPDNWIYVQEPDVKLGRLQIFNNWSPDLVADPSTIWLGLEYFCGEGDGLWSMPDGHFVDFAARELAQIGLIDRADVLDGTVVRVPKAYPAYFGEYRGIGQVRACLDTFSNLFPIGRNGMHRYNNQDHSMLAANAAVECILAGHSDKSTLWSVNAEDEYHEEASAEPRAARAA